MVKCFITMTTTIKIIGRHDRNNSLLLDTTLPSGKYRIKDIDKACLDIRDGWTFFSEINSLTTFVGDVDIVSIDLPIKTMWDKDLVKHTCWPANAWTFIDCATREVFTKHHGLEDDYFELPDGKVLIRDYGKYKSGLCFINNAPVIPWAHKDRHELNLSIFGSFTVVYGTFYTSKNGNPCFAVDPDGPHMLIRDAWGGAFNTNRYYGRSLPETGAVYYRRASSNGGGRGYDYAVYGRDWSFNVNRDYYTQ